MPPAPGQDEPLKRMMKIVNSLLSRPDIAPFREPVDWQGLELWDYPQVVKKMSDLGTIKRKLERGYYSTAHQVAEDIRLVWSNCMTYNADGSDFWLLAKSYSRRFEDRYRKVRYEFDVGEDMEDESPSNTANEGISKSSSGAGSRSKGTNTKDTASSSSGPPSTLDARARFGANLFLLGGVELGWVFTELEMTCPHVLESWGESRVEINVDAIPPETFAKLNRYVSDLMAKEIPSVDLDEEVPKKKKRKSS